MAGRVVFFLQHASFESAYQVTSMAITAAAMGDETYIVFAFDALRALSRNAFGLPVTERETAESARAEGLGVPVPTKMLAEARSLGVKLIACDTAVKLCGFSVEDFRTKLDEVMGLASIWRLTQDARVLSF